MGKPAVKHLDALGNLPQDSPSPGGPHRVYVAATNHCNRACPWCSTCSSPRGGSFITLENYLRSFPENGPFEVHLEGGEPTLHPLFPDLVKQAGADPRCQRVVICTNGATMPRDMDSLELWLGRFGPAVGIKLSINHHLMENDSDLIKLAQAAAQVAGRQGKMILFNVRLRKGVDDDDRAVRDAVDQAGLSPMANVFFLRRYGFAAQMADWEPPILVGENFRMVNPDGTVFGPDLVARSEAMRRLA